MLKQKRAWSDKWGVAGLFLVSVFLTCHPVFAQVPDPSGNPSDSDIATKARKTCKEANVDGCECRQLVGEKLTSFGTCVDESQKCSDGQVYFSCCICEQPLSGGSSVTIKKADSGYTYTSCQELCTGLNPPGQIYRQLGAGTLPQPQSKTAPTAAQVQASLAMCFTPKDCASADYGGSFRVGYGCPSGMGRCMAQEPQIDLSFSLGGIKTVAGLRGYVALVFRYLISIAVVVAAIMFTIGGVRYIFGSAFEGVAKAKEMMVDAGVGLALLLGSITILQTVNPATSTLKKLEIFLINKQQILSKEFCADIQSSVPLQFADAGTPPAYTPLQNISAWPLKQEETRCNSSYYVQGFSDSRCSGRRCDEEGSACISCKSGFCPPGSDPKSYGCVKASFGGNISYSNGRYIKNMMLLAVCKNALSVSTFDDIKEYVIPVTPVKNPTFDTGGINKDQGSQGYTFDLSTENLEDVRAKCGGKGDLLGFVLGVEYNKTLTLGTVVNQALSKACDYSLSGAAGVTGSVDDIAIIGANACGSTRFSGYATGQCASRLDYMQGAILCGITSTPKTLIDPASYWSLERLQKAIGINGQSPDPVICNFDLSDNNAPSDPDSSLNAACFAAGKNKK